MITLTPQELAANLSYLVGGSPPDQTLNDMATAGGLATPDGRETQVRRLVTTQAGRDITPLWSLDGTRIAFASGRSESSRLQGFEYGAEIYLMVADGSAARALTANNACGLASDGEGKLNGLWGAPPGRRMAGVYSIAPASARWTARSA